MIKKLRREPSRRQASCDGTRCSGLDLMCPRTQGRLLRLMEPPMVWTLRRADAPRPTRPLATRPGEAETTRTVENWELIDPKRLRASTRTDEPLGKVIPTAPLVFLKTA